MSEFRQNLATKEWVVIATERARRPHDFKLETATNHAVGPYEEDCPFCPGNEQKTPPALYVDEDEGAWHVRVVPNKYGALQPRASAERRQAGGFLKATGFGVSEVVIETPLHNLSIATMGVAQVERVLQAYRSRYQQIAKDGRINLITIFRNYGPLAGTSLLHPHSQIIATPIIPPHVRDPIRQAVLHFDTYGTCVFCDMIREELAQKRRIVVESDHYLAACPFAARTPFEVRIWPKKHKPCFCDSDNDELADLAVVLRQVLARIRLGLNDPNYNYILRSCPTGDEDVRYLHWYMVIIPKISTPAGFEIGTGIYINTVAPEASAEYLRSVREEDGGEG